MRPVNGGMALPEKIAGTDILQKYKIQHNLNTWIHHPASLFDFIKKPSSVSACLTLLDKPDRSINPEDKFIVFTEDCF